MRFSAVLKNYVSFNTFLVLSILCLLLLLVYKPQMKLISVYTHQNNYHEIDDKFGSGEMKQHQEIVNLYFEKRKNWKTSNLGSILFKNASIDVIKANGDGNNRKFLILIWKYWKWLENRHVNNFNSKSKKDPLSDCSVKNCKFTGNDDELNAADAIVVHIQRGVFPNTTKRNWKQRWIFLSDESPVHSFSMAKTPPKIPDLAYVFNWSMTYRSDSDVPVPYGRTIALQKPILNGPTASSLSTLVPHWDKKRRDVLAAILISNCGVSRRMNYLQNLEEHMTVDVYGRCSETHKDSCPGHFRSDCELLSEYLFYLVFENSECKEYLTEKSFYHAYSKGAIPVIMGPSVDICAQLLPPDSFLHVDDYDSPQSLINHMIRISEDDRLILEYHKWRNDFAVLNEHGYFGSKSYHLCRICEALNYNDGTEKVYDEESIRNFLDPALSCRFRS